MVARWTGVCEGAGGAPVGEAGGAAGPVGGAGGFEVGGFEVGGVTEATEGWGGGPGSAVVGPVVDTFPEVGAPRPRRRGGPEVLRCTGRGPAPDGVLGATGLTVGTAGAVGPPRLGPEEGEFVVAAVPAGEPGATGLPVPVAAPVEVAALLAGAAAGPAG